MIKLVRLDYRLLHGQVVFSWTGHVGAQRIIVVDDDAANDEMKKSALLLSKPAGVRVNIFTVDKAIAKMPKVEQLDEKIMMICPAQVLPGISQDQRDQLRRCGKQARLRGV